MRTLYLPLGLAALLLSPFAARAQPATSPCAPVACLTLEQAQALAAARSFDLSAARREVEASEGGVRQAEAFRNPELNATVEDTRAATRTTTTTLGFPVEWGGKRAARIGVAERSRDLARAQLTEASSSLRAAVLSAYFSAVVGQERVKLVGDSAQLAERAAEMVGKRVAAGKASPVEATRARVDALNARLEVEEARAQWRSARQALAATLGDTAPHFDAVDVDIGTAPARPDAASLLQQVDAAPSLISLRREIDRRKAAIGVERSKAAPDLVVSAGVKRDNASGRTQAVVGIAVPLPLFDRNQGAVLEASRRAEKAQDEYEAARVRLVANVQEAAAQLATARASLQAIRDTVLPAALQAYDASMTGFEAGKFGLVDVLDAQRSLLQARARSLNTLSSAWQAAAAIDRLLGR